MPTFDLTPDPKILVALTHTPMQPLDALCELIDNSIDSFHVAMLQGNPVQSPLIAIELPRLAELKNNSGAITVLDNGPGLTRDMAEKAIRAGFSGNNPYDTLGLFGMGFNISTGKLGRVTRFLTARSDESHSLEVIIDLDKILESRSYQVPFNLLVKLLGYGDHGTLVEVNGWWPEGNPNNGFIRKLVQYGLPKVREEIGRRYATILRNRNIRILINGDPCMPFDHCIWGDSRYVERRGHGKIPAVFRFDEVIGAQKRCTSCTALIPPETSNCPSCGSSSLRTIEERISGWVGVQRFDSYTEYGIDLIRNGRAIRIGEKNAFFEYVDEFKKTIKDYPIDSPYGRIVGEVQLNHVPVDYLKQDFQKSSPEWLRAMKYLRGESSLQPTQPNADKNTSPVYKLYQGFRRVRTPGKNDMYMGYWDKDKERSERISRDIEKEYYNKFLRKVPGYYDDSEWWKLIEQAETRPLEELVVCPSCGAQNLQGHDICSVCGHVLIGKTCINPDCAETIAQSAQTCPVCGTSQVVTVEEPWTCLVCGTRNNATREACINCSEPRGTENTLSREYLLKNSNKADDLSIPGCSVLLADGGYSPPLDIDTYVTKGSIIPNQRKSAIPLVALKGERVEIFIDKAHQVFKTYGVRPEQMIAGEVALYLYDLNRRLSGQQYYGIHALSNLEWMILRSRWSDALEDSAERVKNDIHALFDSIRALLPDMIGELASDYFDELDGDQKKKLVDNMLSHNEDISKIGEMKASGKYLYYIDEETVVSIFNKSPGLFFDGKFWDTPYTDIPELLDSIIEEVQRRTWATYLNCLEDVASFLRYRSPEGIVIKRARTSLEFLRQRMVSQGVH